MQVVYLGKAPREFLADDWTVPPEPLYDQPMFAVDILFVFAGQQLEAGDRARYELVETSGRPIVRVGAVLLPVNQERQPGNLLLVANYSQGEATIYEQWATERPRSNYVSVDCGFYDLIEKVAVSNKEVQLTMRRANGVPMTTHSGIKSTKTHRKEEYVQLTDECWIRMDRILSIDGTPAPGPGSAD
ncbi:hypothetical protein CLV84_4280 [Neolewinella xylanilytica]|uniref:Uncharacterized protein n=1 Tax=Neolewinella xylanilytica TaxID=1514080 RepID=A0A2S6I020_9BACT|nr:hypothetical protein [Neolewinella xylanilytica]PPK84129.1 hypothetical protein CLV84_4280 [Neolewinella xylanilytica]